MSLGQDIDVKKECGSYGMGIQQMVEIAKAVLIDAKLIIMDEPTSSLGEKEVAQLMKTVRSLKEKGISILFVSHKTGRTLRVMRPGNRYERWRTYSD